MLIVVLIVISLVQLVTSFTPLLPTAGWTYYLEAAHSQAWPACPYRFASYSSACNSIDTWKAAGVNQEWTLVDAGGGNFYLQASCGAFLSVSGDCNSPVVDLWPQAGINQAFRFISSGNTKFELYIEAVGRSQCSTKYLSFPGTCTTSSPDKIDLWSGAGENQRFRLHPVRYQSIKTQSVGSSFVCPDPFVWQPRNSTNYMIQCTGGGIQLGMCQDIRATNARFSYLGDSLGGSPSPWAAESAFDSRWAPENYESPDGKFNYVFFSDTQPDGLHRMGWVASSTGNSVNSWNYYSSNFLNLGMAAGGDIDGSIFQDANGKTYLTWKTDDNNVGSPTTRLWLQEIIFNGLSVTQVGPPTVIMDSTGLWWVDSWVSGGSLVEGPEIVQRGGYYYVFFAAGKFCQSTYAEGVARSLSIWGPYEKLGVPVLSTGIVGYSTNTQGSILKLVGPGHATIVNNRVGRDDSKAASLLTNTTLGSTESWSIVWHASIGDNCNRYAFINQLQFGADGWPFVNFA